MVVHGSTGAWDQPGDAPGKPPSVGDLPPNYLLNVKLHSPCVSECTLTVASQTYLHIQINERH